jgi:MYXO-CTERM domain-containing protein
MQRLLTSLLWVMLSAASASALVINGGSGTGQTTAPGSGVPWDNVGAIGGTTGIYLGTFGGGYWALTAAHVGAGNLTLGSTTYSYVAGSSVRVLNSDNSNADLVLFRLATDPGLPNLSLTSIAPPNTTSVVLIGRGGVEGSLNYWSVANGPGPADAVWTNLGSTSAGSNVSGYLVASSIGLRWGTNAISGSTTYDIGTGLTTALYTDFSGVAGDAQGAVGDSGGAAFAYDGSNWLLVGVLGAIGTFENQPGSTAVVGNLTYLASIATYSSFITAAIPEPSSWAAAAGVLALGLAVLRRRQEKRRG